MENLFGFLLFALIVGGVAYFVLKNKKKKKEPIKVEAPVAAPTPVDPPKPVEPPKPTPKPVEPPKTEAPSLKERYSDIFEFNAFVESGFGFAILLDDVKVLEGRGPALMFKSMPDGSVVRQ